MPIYVIFLTLGALFALGLLTDEAARRTGLPRVTLLILLGVAAGPIGLDLVPAQARDWYEFLATSALTMIAFLIGGSLSLASLRRHGRQIITISLSVSFSTLVLMSVGLWLLGTSIEIALLLAGIAAATAPAATQDVINEMGAKSDFSKKLLGIVAIDDAWGLILFSFVLVLASILAGNGSGSGFLHGIWEITGGILLGVVIGLPAAFMTGRLRRGLPMQSEALTVTFLSAGLALWLGVSFLIAGMVAGAIIVNFARHHLRAFHEIEHVERPFMILFFFMAGASLEQVDWGAYALLIAGYILLRTLARVVGGFLGAWLGGAPRAHAPWYGLAMLPQAGVNIGMALVAGEYFPEYSELILTVTVATTIVFEIFGPLGTRRALSRLE